MAQATSKEVFWGTGRRKSAVARVRLLKGEGKFIINDKELESEVFTEQFKMLAKVPLLTTHRTTDVDVHVTVNGGGVIGQACAISHGLSRALEKMDSTHRPVLKKEGLLTRDSRVRERQKPGRAGARKRFQFSKR